MSVNFFYKGASDSQIFITALQLSYLDLPVIFHVDVE